MCTRTMCILVLRIPFSVTSIRAKKKHARSYTNPKAASGNRKLRTDRSMIASGPCYITATAKAAESHNARPETPTPSTRNQAAENTRFECTNTAPDPIPVDGCAALSRSCACPGLSPPARQGGLREHADLRMPPSELRYCIPIPHREDESAAHFRRK
ncbi:hypothetical protein DFH11DRAFT_510949 [Phellopilus nigrolimitatus]|nr:hypothetical protein DFH11DRAFT_510949 [Phellopilus nigrolimitatus]